MPHHRPYVVLHDYVFMPNHFHGIIEITCRGVACYAPAPTERDARIVSHVVAAHDLGVARNAPTHANISPKKATLSVIVRAYKSAVTKSIREFGRSTKGRSTLRPYTTFAWQRSYYEHIIRDDEDHYRIVEYIINNPASWQEDRLYTEENVF